MTLNPNDRAQIAAARDLVKSEGDQETAESLDQVLIQDARQANADRAQSK